jgi:hypothetical protein
LFIPGALFAKLPEIKNEYSKEIKMKSILAASLTFLTLSSVAHAGDISSIIEDFRASNGVITVTVQGNKKGSCQAKLAAVKAEIAKSNLILSSGRCGSEDSWAEVTFK